MRRRPTEDAACREVAGVHQKLQELEGGEVDLKAEFGSSEATEIGGRLSCLLWSQRPVPGSGLGKSAEFPGPTTGWDLRNCQPSGPRMEVMRSILVHCTPSHHPPFTSSSVFLLQLLAVLPVLQFQSLQYESDTKKSFLALID